MRPVLALLSVFVLELTRRRTPFLFLLGLAGCAVFLPRLAQDGEPLRSRLQLATSYGVGFPVVLIALGTVAMAAGAISSDVESHRIQTVLVKACSGWQVLLGKFLGILAVVAVSLCVVLLAFAVNLANVTAFSGPTSEEAGLAWQRFFTPRVPVYADLPPIDEVRLREYTELLKTAPGSSRGLGDRELEAQARRWLRNLTVRPGEHADLTFRGLRPRGKTAETLAGERLILSYRLHWSPPGGGPHAECSWEVYPGPSPAPGAQPLFVSRERASRGIANELALPATLVPASASLCLRIRNPAAADEGRTLVVDPLQVEILTSYGTFLPGVLRAFALVFSQLALLAAIGLLGSAVFSRPTASLVGLFVYLTGLASGFLRETFYRETVVHPRTFFEQLSGALSGFSERVLNLLPDLGGLEPVDRRISGCAIPVAEFSIDLCWLLLVQAALLLVLGAWLLSRRELAGVSG